MIIRKRSLSEANPEAAEMWDDEENKKRGLLSPTLMGAGSNKIAQFRCLDNPEHVFDSKICDMTDRDGNNRGCKICRRLGLNVSSSESNTIIRTQVSFFEYIPEAKKMFDLERNYFNGEEISPFANIEAHFICENGHRFKKTVANFSQAPRCPECKPSISDSKPELLLFFDFNKNDNNSPDNISSYSSDPIHWRCPSCNEMWVASPKRINETSKNRCPKCGYKEKLKYGQTFRKFNPNAAKYWIQDKNGKLTPDNTRPNSRDYIYMRCPNNPEHIFKIRINKITHFSPYGCKCCEKPKITPDISFAAFFPNLLKEYSTNNSRDPYSLSEISQTEYEWFCKKHNHYWYASPLARTRGEKRCKYCIKEKASKFSQMHPYLAKYYDEEKNTIPYKKITEKGNPKVFWKCEKGHSFSYRITNFSRKGKFECPVCKGRIVIEGQTDLLSQYPDIAKDYDNKKNKNPPDKISIYNTNSDTNWLCYNGHESKMSVKRKIANKGICPKCGNNTRNSVKTIKIRKETNNQTLAKKYPLLESIWDREKNSKGPEEYSYLHDEMIFALCPRKKHKSYPVRITTLINNNFKCLACEGRILVKGFNSLVDLHPNWLQEWDYISNNTLLIYPTEILDNYSEDLWWICRMCGERFKMAPNKYRDYEIREKTKCPYCKGKRRNRNRFG